MVLIAENLTVTRPAVARAVRERDVRPLAEVSEWARRAGAAYLDVNLGAGRWGGPDAVEYVLGALEDLWGGGVLIDTTNPAVMDRAARCWKGELVLNGYSGDPDRDPVLEVAAKRDCSVVVLLMAGGIPRTADERLALAAELAGRCAGRGIGPDRLWFDPMVAPLGWPEGQECDAAFLEILRSLPDVLGAPVRTLAGLSNLTTGAAGGTRVPWLQEVFLAAAAGAGLTHVMLDVGNARLLRVAKAIEVLSGHRLFAPDDLV